MKSGATRRGDAAKGAETSARNGEVDVCELRASDRGAVRAIEREP
jgi:hypothetical protein